MKNFRNILLSASLTVALFAACSGNGGLTVSGLDPAKFDSTVNEKPVKLYTLKNSKGMEVCITNFGGRIVSLCVPDKTGKPTDVVLGCDNLKEYTDTINSPSDFGASIGRYANRINKGQLTIEGKKIQLPINNFGHCLHGGPSGWQYQVYDANQLNDSTLQLTMNSKDGDNNFPGNVKAIVTYTVKSNNSLDIKYEATTDKETVINMTNHSYFNLTGDLTKPGMDMVLYINADNYTPTDATFMTTR
jgi:aldose 1-epimerase